MPEPESRLWADRTAPQLRAFTATPEATVIVPVGSTEQHGPHLPVAVDWLLASEVAQRAARRLSGRPVLVAPSMWVGLAEHHMGLGATLTLDFDAFRGVLLCVCRSLARLGVRRVLLLNGHGGNHSALQAIADEAAIAHGAAVAAASYWDVAAPAYRAILERQHGILHACEAETSMLLALRPDLVDAAAIAQADRPVSDDPFEPFGRGLNRWADMREMTDNGVVGVPSAASAEKGERLLEAAADALAEALRANRIWRPDA